VIPMRLLVIALLALPSLGLKANSWQARLDKALLDVDVEPRARMRLLQRAVRDPDLQKDVRRAVTAIRTQGMGKGHPKVIELLWPTGTTARSDIESLFALRKQVPEVLEDLSKSPPSFRGSSSSAAAAPDPASLLSSIATLATDQEKQKELKEEAKDLLRPTPKGLETPKYKVVRVLDGPLFLGRAEPIEVRLYDEFTVARTKMSAFGFGTSSGGAGFTTLASYLFGDNEEKRAMAMTMPVEVSAAGGGEGSMAFVLPAQDASAPPTPLAGSDVTITQVPARLVAAKAFPGIVTDDEVARQKAALLEALAADGSLTPVDAEQLSVLQYNSPLTIPWRRRNELVLAVVETEATPPPAEADAAAEGAAAVPVGGVVSWYDAGVRLQPAEPSGSED